MRKKTTALVPAERVVRSIVVIRGEKVILDSDLALLYGVTTAALNQAVKRNRRRFPNDFAFQLTRAEMDMLNRSQFVIGSGRHRDPRYPPWAFTEHGALASAFVLNTPLAVAMSTQVVRAFVRLREMLRTNEDLSRRVAALERRTTVNEGHVRQLASAFEKVQASPPRSPSKRIGFEVDDGAPAPPSKRSGKGALVTKVRVEPRLVRPVRPARLP